jgi:hypothetical protein
MESLTQYKQHEIVVDSTKANLFVFLLFIPAAIVFGLPFFLLWKKLFTMAYLRLYLQDNLDWLKRALPFIIFGSMIGGVIAHELLHAITWARAAKSGFKAIRFGMIWKSLTPYCHCTEQLSLNAYRLGVIMPGLVLGFLPLMIGFIIGHIGLFLFGFFFTIAAGGDFIMMYLLRYEAVDSFVQDHPDKIGCIVFRKE